MKHNIKILYDMEIPMRDGVILRADLYCPDTTDKVPAVLLRFPYNKDGFETRWGRLDPLPLSRAGYAVVIEDCRGTGASCGLPDFDGEAQRHDGYDTIEWIAAQSWCDGNIGMYGLSYYGFTQLLAAEEQPPHLKAICPWQQTGLLKYSGGFTTGSLHLMWLLERARDWLGGNACTLDEKTKEEAAEKVNYYLNHFGEVVEYMPEAENPAAFIEGLPFLEDYARRIREADDPKGPEREGRPIDFSKIRIPCFFLGGWYDETSKNGPVENWMAIAAQENGPSLLSSCRMIMGPWNHGEAIPAKVGCRDFGEDAVSPMGKSIQDLLIEWFDWHLRGIPNALSGNPPVCLYTMGRNTWRYEDAWPPAGICIKKLYLGGDGRVSAGSGTLGTELQETGEEHFLYDPAHPVPARILEELPGECQYQDKLMNRNDTLVFMSGPLEQELEVTGEVRAELYISSSCPDTDFVCRLLQMDENGRTINITDGAVRASYNNTYTRTLLVPDEVRCLTVHMGNTSNAFGKGTRIGLLISGSSFPKYDRNHNTADAVGSSERLCIADNIVHHSKEYPSGLLLPVRKAKKEE